MCFITTAAAIAGATTAAATAAETAAVVVPVATTAATAGGTAVLAAGAGAITDAALIASATGAVTTAAAAPTLASTVLGITGAAGLGTLSLDMTLVSVVGGIASAVSQSKNAQEAAKFNEDAAKAAALEEHDAASQRAAIVIRDSELLASSQRAAFGSSGFDVNTGDPISIIQDTLSRGAHDAAAEFQAGNRKYNARMIDASNARAYGQSARNQGLGSVAGTILGGTGTVADVWYKFNRG